jgi:pilus assembly protein Flp/PilA
MAGLSLIIAKFTADESGATAIEYGLIAALVGMGIVGAFTVLSNEVGGIFNYIVDTAGVAMATAFD